MNMFVIKYIWHSLATIINTITLLNELYLHIASIKGCKDRTGVKAHPGMGPTPVGPPALQWSS